MNKYESGRPMSIAGWCRGLVLAGSVLAANSVAAEIYELEGEGIVQGVDLAAGEVTVTGFAYVVDSDARIEVGGRITSIAALAHGMKVRIVYEVRDGIDAQIAGDNNRLRLMELEQLPDSYPIEEF